MTAKKDKKEKKLKAGPMDTQKIKADYRKVIQKLRLSEEKLRASERKYRSLVESIPDIIFALDLDGSLSYIGARWKNILGHEDSEVLGQFFIHFAPPEEHHFLVQVFKEIRDKGQNVENIRLQFLSKEGQRRYFSCSAAPIFDEQGKVIGAMGIARDITEHKKLEEQILQAQKMESIGNLAGGIAHDFNNLLAGILGYASFLKKKLPAQDPLFHSVDLIERSAQKATELTKQLLGFARKGKYEVKPINCNVIIQDLVQFLGRTIDRRVSIVVDLDPQLHLIEGDEVQIQQSFMNICLNARDAMPGGGLLTINTRNQIISRDLSSIQQGWKEGAYVKITISDNGAGIPPEIHPQIFEPFFTTKEPGRGTGLGLSMVYVIIQNHGGFIDFQSNAETGTSFDIFLPSKTLAEIETVSPPRRSNQAGSETILLVDDEEVIRQLGADILEDMGYKVLTASRGEEALQIYRHFSDTIALVVLDVVMPGMGGKATFLRLREFNPEIRVLLSSGYSTEGEVEEILREGVGGFIQKPYREDEFIGKIRELLDSSSDIPK